MEKSIFTLKELNNEIVVLKVNCNSTLDAAKHPYVDMNDDYISVTRGKDHLMSIIHKDGSSQSFHFGESRYTLIGNDLELLKTKVLDYLNDNHILIKYRGEPLRAANIFYNDNYRQWELTLEKTNGSSICYFNKNAHSADEMIEECKPFVEAEKWDFGKAQTGIDIWRANNPKFNIVSTEKKLLQESKVSEDSEKLYTFEFTFKNPEPLNETDTIQFVAHNRDEAYDLFCDFCIYDEKQEEAYVIVKTEVVFSEEDKELYGKAYGTPEEYSETTYATKGRMTLKEAVVKEKTRRNVEIER